MTRQRGWPRASRNPVANLARTLTSEQHFFVKLISVAVPSEKKLVRSPKSSDGPRKRTIALRSGKQHIATRGVRPRTTQTDGKRPLRRGTRSSSQEIALRAICPLNRRRATGPSENNGRSSARQLHVIVVPTERFSERRSIFLGRRISGPIRSEVRACGVRRRSRAPSSTVRYRVGSKPTYI